MPGFINGVRYVMPGDVYDPPVDSQLHAQSDAQQALDAASIAAEGAVVDALAQVEPRLSSLEARSGTSVAGYVGTAADLDNFLAVDDGLAIIALDTAEMWIRDRGLPSGWAGPIDVKGSATAAAVAAAVQTQTVLAALTRTGRRPVGQGELIEDAATHGMSPSATAAANTTALAAAVATGRPVLIPGGPGTIYPVGDLAPVITNNTHLIGHGATLRAAGPEFAHLAARTGLHIDGLTFDAAGLADVGLRLTGCTDFTIGTVEATGGRSRGIHFEGCADWHADTLITDSNGRSGSVIGSGVYLTDHAGLGNTGFTIGTVRGKLNGLGAGQDGQTLHTNGTCRGSIAQVYAHSNTRYGAKFQHTAGHVVVGTVHATGNPRNVSTPGVNGLTIGTIVARDSTDISVWIDAAASNVHLGTVDVIAAGLQGFQVVTGATNLTVDSLMVRNSGTTGPGRGVDIRGVTRGQFGSITVIDAGSGATNPTDVAFHIDSLSSEDVQIGQLILRDNRTGTARCPAPANLFGAVDPARRVRIGMLHATGFQNDTVNNLNATVCPRVMIGGKGTRTTGTVTIPAGETSAPVTHGLFTAPARVLLTGSSADTAQAWVSNLFSGTFQVNVPAAVFADRHVHWIAEMA